MYNRTRTSRRRTSRSSSPGELSFKEMTSQEHLLQVWYRLKAASGQAAGVDGVMYDDLGRSEAAAAMRVLSRALRKRRYRPAPRRRIRLPKPGGGHRALELPTIVDRVVATALNDVLSTRMEPVFLGCSYGFRPGRSTGQALEALRGAVEAGSSWVLQDDIADAFPSLPVFAALDGFGPHGNDNWQWLVELLLAGPEQRRIGISQGCPLSPLALNVALHHVLDLPHAAADRDAPLYVRYADNLAWAGRSASEVQTARQEAYQRLADAGLRLKGQTARPINLRRNGARIEILGLQLQVEGDRALVRPGGKAFQSLHLLAREAACSPEPIREMQLALEGWISANGLNLESKDLQETSRRAGRALASYGLGEIVRTNSLSDAPSKAKRKGA